MIVLITDQSVDIIRMNSERGNDPITCDTQSTVFDREQEERGDVTTNLSAR